ncbi:alpha/beta fold hydrolase [Paraburkholderia diazotrophica]|uniref:Pimeloyl-ACP methyl ester carboxylesterase n=1 Tax=Paraburkholderia diazotrophica TaxID=667676 RepID=A0A1H7CSW1_9BURK|nr:alpha/beta hydrolase [Paraburkholderia diazotrophica]SEJ88905.1 Pimeloyl-ACP methyl ester carboxylesterase [Paraburkholderia diazotrophica]
MSIPIAVLVHGGHFAADCWSAVVNELGGKAIAFDLPGRGRHRDESLEGMTLERHARSVIRDMDDANIERAVLVGHSMGGSVICTVAALAPERVERLVFVSAPIAPHGMSNIEAMTPEIKTVLSRSRDAGDIVQQKPPKDFTRYLFCNDMSTELADATCELVVADSIAPLLEPVPFAGVTPAISRTFIKLARDVSFSPDAQDRTIATLQAIDVVEIDAGHMVMLSNPEAIARVLLTLI